MKGKIQKNLENLNFHIGHFETDPKFRNRNKTKLVQDKIMLEFVKIVHSKWD